ncbi:hypothetical protein FRC01_002567, partial [Tulasnella sp. 417]
MDTESRRRRRFVWSHAAASAELSGALTVPDLPVIATSSTKVYCGVWKSPRGEEVDVAVKEFGALLPRNLHRDPQALQEELITRFKRELIVWTQRIHPNLHPCLGYRLEPRPRLISPWCRHGNLTDYLSGNPDLSRVDKLRLIYQAALGLAHLHSLTPPICHADIKPENVLINDKGEAALTDFGLSRILQDLGEPNGLTSSGTVRGTLRYMATELHREEKQRPDRQTDVYAFGGLILAVMSGKPPFWGLRDATILLHIVKYETPKPEEHPDLPPDDGLWSLIRHCWRSKRTARPAMREILSELAGVLEVSRLPELTTGYADVYHGICTPPRRAPLEVAIKEFKALIPRSRQSDREALRRKAET